MCLLVTKKSIIITVTIFSFLACQLLHIFGKVIVLRGALQPTSYSRKLICLSEDDGSALVWNILTWNSEFVQSNNTGFSSISALNNNNRINCKMNNYEDCLKLWSTEGWTITSSSVTSMAPVFDQRWEEFPEYKNPSKYYLHIGSLKTSVALSFSIRAPKNAHILFCKNKYYETNLCYWVVIGSWENKKSVIQKCPNGLDFVKTAEYPSPQNPCANIKSYINHTALSANEWRSFVIKLDSVTRNITFYHTDNNNITYHDAEIYGPNKQYEIFIGGYPHTLFRFHLYNFLHTTTENAILTSPTFQVNDATVCVQMFIGLCAECEAHVYIRDSTYKELKNVTVKSASKTAVHSLPTWQSIKIKKNFTRTSSLFVQVIPKLYVPTSSPLWAIANVRQCPPTGSWRQSVVDFVENEMPYYEINNAWKRDKLNVSCQKLFYDKNTVVNSTNVAKKNITLDENCDKGKLGPKCLVSCERDLGSTYDCKNTVICYKNGCTCPPGFLGETCSNSCERNKYGHDCKKTCGACAETSYLKSSLCDNINGGCLAGCNTVNYDKKRYIQPLCQTAVDASVLPVINYISKTRVQVMVPMTWKDEYEEIQIKYAFTIYKNKQLNSGIYSDIDRWDSAWSNIFPNTTYLIGNFENLKPGTKYKINYTLNFENMHVSSDSLIVETDCDPTENFNIKAEEGSLTVNWQIDTYQLYLCPENKYHFIIIRNDGLEIVNETVTSFPHDFFLTSYNTLYNVTILYKSRKLYSKEIRTLEGVPSNVLDLQTNVFSNKIILTWRAPDRPNGIIKHYKTTYRVQEYYGCENLHLSASNNYATRTYTTYTTNTTITIYDLQPYANYSVKVTACNSRHSSTGTEIFFQSKESEVPAETFSQLVLSKEFILSWNKPKDCTTISGRLLARIKIHGVSKDVKNFSFVVHTQFSFVDLKKASQLHGAELYMARVYVVRDANSSENASAYLEHEFQLPPTAPPTVTNLDVMEIDNDYYQYKTVFLRWQSPIPPINGKLDYYVIRICHVNYRQNCENIRVPINKTCDLWDNYICDTATLKSRNLKIQILAYNINVGQPSDPVSVTQEMLDNTVPDAPGKFNFTIMENSIIYVKWTHPWRTGEHLQYFLIEIYKTSSNLTNSISNLTSITVTIQNYTRYYEEWLHVFPSTQYLIEIRAVTTANKFSSRNSLILQTPTTINFDGNLDIEKFNFTMLLKIPPVSNDTLNSKMCIIVKGPKESCKQHLEVPSILKTQISMKDYESAWQAAEGSTRAFANKTFIVGNNKTYGHATNCPLKPERSYEIIIVLKEENLIITRTAIAKYGNLLKGDDSSKHHEAWLIPIICLILIGSAVYFYRRKKQQLTKQIILQNETTSVISKQDLSTPSDRQSLSRATTPDISLIALENNGKKKLETASLVKVKDFEDYVRQAIQSGLLDEQYKSFPRGQTQPWDYGKLPQNKSKNRYANLIAYDETRVILNKLEDDTYSDYINANYITGYKKKKCYIATQGPKPNTIIDFWRMIWQERVLIICMLANVIESGKIKCEQYWPEIGKKKKYGDVIVLNARHNVFADYCFRIFQVTCGDEIRKIEHLHYTAWPDHDVPLYTHSVVTYLKKLLATSPGNGPIAVHCSAGVGRTGTIILCDICLHRAAAEGFVDVFAEMATIRRERANMVDNKQQYLLAHIALMECLLSIPTTLLCNDMLPARINELKKQLLLQQQRLQSTAWQNEALRQVTMSYPLSERNRAKNRFPELISDKVSRIYLKRYPPTDEDSDYISAVYVDGVKLKNQYVATQLPMPSTINDFWRMIAELKVELILMLQPPDLQDPTCCAIFPMSDEVFTPTPYLNITTTDIMEFEYYTSQKLLLVDNSEKPSREQSVTILCLTEWKPGRDQPPPSVMSMVTFWQATERIARGNGPTVTLCHDGVTGCGLYLALSFLLERMAVERECDVCLAIRAVRRSRSDFVQSLEHMEYLYDAVVAYLKYFETYANFS